MPKVFYKQKFRTVYQSATKGDYVHIRKDGKVTRHYLKAKGVYSKHRVGVGAHECIQGPKRCLSLARKPGRDAYKSANKKDLPALLARCLMAESGRCQLQAAYKKKPASKARARLEFPDLPESKYYYGKRPSSKRGRPKRKLLNVAEIMRY